MTALENFAADARRTDRIAARQLREKLNQASRWCLYRDEATAEDAEAFVRLIELTTRITNSE